MRNLSWWQQDWYQGIERERGSNNKKKLLGNYRRNGIDRSTLSRQLGNIVPYLSGLVGVAAIIGESINCSLWHWLARTWPDREVHWSTRTDWRSDVGTWEGGNHSTLSNIKLAFMFSGRRREWGQHDLTIDITSASGKYTSRKHIAFFLSNIDPSPSPLYYMNDEWYIDLDLT